MTHFTWRVHKPLHKYSTVLVLAKLLRGEQKEHPAIANSESIRLVSSPGHRFSFNNPSLAHAASERAGTIPVSNTIPTFPLPRQHTKINNGIQAAIRPQERKRDTRSSERGSRNANRLPTHTSICAGGAKEREHLAHNSRIEDAAVRGYLNVVTPHPPLHPPHATIPPKRTDSAAKIQRVGECQA